MNSTYSFDNLNSSNSSNSSNTSNNSLLGILLAISPLIIGGLIAILCCMYYIIFNIKTKCYHSYIDYYDNKLKPIKNRQLNINYIKEINIQNKNIEHYDSSTCSICLEDLNLDSTKNINKFAYLDCGHIYHTKCIQKWSKSQIKNIINPSCPSCSQIIVPDIKINIGVESDDNSDYD